MIDFSPAPFLSAFAAVDPMLPVWLLACGVLMGFLAGLLGIGGGMVAVPLLYQLFSSFHDLPSVDMRVAVATSLAIITLTSWRSARLHNAGGFVDRDLFRLWSFPLFLGAMLGSVWASSIEASLLHTVFLSVVAILGLVMGFGPAPLKPVFQFPRPPYSGLLAIMLGAVAALLGLGGAFLMFPLLLLGGVRLPLAAGTAAACGFVVAVPATLVYVLQGLNEPALPFASLGYVNLLALAFMAPVSLWCTKWGALWARRLSPPLLQRLFALLQAMIVLKMLLA